MRPKIYKGIYYFADYLDAATYAVANHYPTDRIISYTRGWAIQLRVSGPYVGPDTKPRKKNPAERFTAKQLATLRKEMAQISGIDPAKPTYKKLARFLDGLSQPLLKQLAKARIKFISGLALNRVKREGNPKMARKKKRTAKQLANDRRLGRMAKARAKKKRGKKKTKKRMSIAKRGKMLRRTFNPKRTALKKSHLWIVFKCRGKTVQYFTLSGTTFNWTGSKAKAILLKTKEHATRIANKMAKKPGMRKYDIGVAPDNMTSAQIVSQCMGKA